MENNKNSVANNILTGVSIAAAATNAILGFVQLGSWIVATRRARKAAKLAQATDVEVPSSEE